MDRLTRLVPMVAAAGLLSITACGSSNANSSGAGGAGGQTVNIGFLANLTGPGAPYGVPFNNGLTMALKEVQSSGTLPNISINVDTRDTGSVEANAVTLFNKFVQAKDPITISDSQSPIGLAVAPIANSQSTVFLSGGGSKLPNDKGFSFRLADLGTPQKTLGTALYTRGAKRVATIIAGDNPSFATLAKATEAAYKAAGGGDFVASQTITSSDTDFSSVLTNLRQANPDTIFISTLPAQSGNIIKQIKSVGGLDSATLVGTIAWNPQVFDIAKSAAVGAEFASVWAPGAPATAGFESAYKSAYNATPIAYSALGYETGWLLAAAIKSVTASGGTVTAAAIRDALPAASQSDILKQHGVIPGFTIAAGAANYPGVLSVFGSDGSIKAAG